MWLEVKERPKKARKNYSKEDTGIGKEKMIIYI